MKKLILALLPVLALLAGCHKQDSYTYSGIEAGTIASGTFTSDNGTRMAIAGNEGKYDVSTSRRVLVSYETLPIMDTDQIRINLLGLLEAAFLQPERARSLPEDPTGLPLEVSDAWFSDEYLNILATFEGKESDDHTFSATYVVDDKGLSIRINHDGPQAEATGNSLMSIFLCTPMYEPVLSYDQIAQAAGQKAVYPVPVLLQWSARTLGNGPLALMERKGSYQPASAD